MVPLASEHATRYYDDVARQRAAVREASGGRLGYLRIPDMMAAGWAEFHRDLSTEFGREGLIVDFRDAQGGGTSQLVVEKLARRGIGWYMSRHEAEPSSYPAEAPRGPVVAITDEYAMFRRRRRDPGAEVLRHRHRGRHPYLGRRDRLLLQYDLLDGTMVTQPASALWVDGVGWAVENHGVDPDVEVIIAPHDWAAGRDPQLDTAIRLALQALEQRS